MNALKRSIRSIATFAGAGMLFLASQNVRADWNSGDIGSVGQAGDFNYDPGSGTYTVTGAGAGVAGSADALYYVYRTIEGDSEITVAIDSLSGEDPYTAAGLMIRESLNPNSKQAFLSVSHEDGVNFVGRNGTGGNVVKTLGPDLAAPVWLRMQRVGTSILGYVSTDGVTWTLVGRTEVAFASAEYYVGFGVSSAVPGTLATGVFGQVQCLGDLPYGISGLRLWLRADTGVISGTGSFVAEWEDQSGSGNNASQGTASFQPVWLDNELNGLPVLRFNGTNSYLSVADASSLKPAQLTAFVVGKHSGGEANGLFLGKTTSGSFSDGYGIMRTASGTKVGMYVKATASMASIPLAADTYGLMSGSYNAERVEFSLKGGATATTLYSTAIDHSAQPLYLGSRGGLSNRLGGDIAEVLLFDRALADSDHSKVETYLSNKYGIAPDLKFGIPGGTYPGSQSVTLSGPPGAAIYYTLDGSVPTTGSTAYAGPISINSTATLKAIYVLAGQASGVFSATYTIDAATSFISREGLAMWLRADVGVIVDSGTVAKWEDQSGNGSDAVAPAPTNGPILVTNVLGGRPVLRFNGTNKYLILGPNLNSASALPFTMIIVTNGVANPRGLFDSAPGKSNGFFFSSNRVEFANSAPFMNFTLDSAGSIASVMGQVGGDGRRLLTVFGNKTTERSDLTNYDAANDPGTLTIVNPLGTQAFVTLVGTADDSLVVSSTAGITNFVNQSTLNGTYENTNISFSLDEGASFTFSATNPTGGYNGYDINVKHLDPTYVPGQPIAGSTSPVVFSDAWIGRRNSNYYAGDIAEVIFYNRAITNTERTQIESYLGEKYGIDIFVPGPAPSVPGGIYQESQNVTFSPPADTVIYYTLDGSTPTSSSTVYTGTIPITETKTLKAISIQGGFVQSELTNEQYIIDSSTETLTRNGLQLWLRADSLGGTSGAAVDRWKDQAGSAKFAEQNLPANQPTLQTNILNGKPILRFDGANHYLALADSPEFNPSQINVVAVVKRSTGGNSTAVVLEKFENSGTSAGFSLLFSSSTAPRLTINATSVTGSLPAGTFGIVEGISNGIQNKISVNGGSEVVVSNTIPITSNTKPTYIGARGTSDRFAGDIAELLVYNRELNSVERKGVQAYLYARYNLGSMPQLPVAEMSAQTIFSGSQTVTMTSPVAGATIRYTTDGSDPTASSAIYDPENPPVLTGTTTVKARIYKDGYAASEVVTMLYTRDTTSLFAREGLALWLRGDLGLTMSGTTVSGWADQSGLGNDSGQGTAANQPVTVSGAVNGKGAVKFDGNDDYLTLPTPPELKPANVTVFVVGKHTDGGTNYRTYFRGGGNGVSEGYALMKRNAAGTAGFNINTYTNSGSYAAGSLAANTYGVMMGRYDGTNVDFYVNSQLAASTPNSAGITSYDSASLSYVGSTGTNYHLTGEIAELLVFNRALSDAERKEVEAYLYARYAIGGPPPAMAPELPPSTVFSGTQTVTMTSPVAEGTIRYTTDGSAPTVASTQYVSPLEFTVTTTVKARVFKTGYLESPVTTATYIRDDDAAFPRSGLKMWLRADASVASGTNGAVSAWEDQSGAGNTALQASGTNQPLLVSGTLNGRPVLRFDGSNDFLAVADAASLKPEKLTMYIVGRRTGGGNSGAVFYKSSTTSYADGYGFVREGATDTYGFYVNSNSANKATGTVLAGRDFQAQAIYDRNRAVLFVNGVPQTPVTSTAAINHTVQPLKIGGSGSGTYSFGGDIAEILLFDRQLTLEEQIAVEKYLDARYDINTDADGDGLPRWKELELGTSPTIPDTNGNGLPDGVEYNLGYDPTSLDSDNDGLTNAQEYALGTNAFWADSDGDGVNDGSDPYPQDPSTSSNTDPTPSVAPTITLELPTNATLLP